MSNDIFEFPVYCQISTWDQAKYLYAFRKLLLGKTRDEFIDGDR